MAKKQKEMAWLSEAVLGADIWFFHHVWHEPIEVCF